MTDASTPGPDQRGEAPGREGAAPVQSSAQDTTPIPSAGYPTAPLPAATGSALPPAGPGTPPLPPAGMTTPPLPPAGSTYAPQVAGAQRPAGRSPVPMIAVVIGAVLVALLALGGGFAGGFVVGHAVGRNSDGPHMVIQGPDGTGPMDRFGQGRMGDRDGFGIAPRTDPRGTDQLPEQVPTPRKTAPTP